MNSRLKVAIALSFASILAAHSSLSQEITSDVVISGASLNDGYAGSHCDDDGQLYRPPVSTRPGQSVSLMRVAKDGSTLLFTLPKPEWSIQVFAPTAAGLAVLTNRYDAATGRSRHMYRFDGQGNLQTERTVTIDFHPLAMAETKSGMTILVGYRTREGTDNEDRTYGGAVLNASDQVVKLFEFPPAADGDKWTTVPSHRMAVDDGGASIIFESGNDPNSSIITISESGQIHMLPLATVRGTRYHDWFFAKGVVAELYQFPSDKLPVPIKIDTFDLTSGRKIGTKNLRSAGFSFACYLGDEMSVLAHSAHVAKSRGLSPDQLRLVTIKLE
jgi:hypothetical protein